MAHHFKAPRFQKCTLLHCFIGSQWFNWILYEFYRKLVSTFYLWSPTTWYSTPVVGKVRDLLYDVTGCHPVTYADTRLTGQGEVPVERVLTNSHLGCCNAPLSFLVVFWIIVLHALTSGAGNVMPLSNTVFIYGIYLYWRYAIFTALPSCWYLPARQWSWSGQLSRVSVVKVCVQLQLPQASVLGLYVSELKAWNTCRWRWGDAAF